MTKFNKENFTNDGMYLHYSINGERKFVARSKKSGGRGELNGMAAFLIKNFEVAEYFDRLEVAKESPLPIMESKGYILPHIKKWLKRDGYPTTREGYDAWFEVRHAATLARMAAEKEAAK